MILLICWRDLANHFLRSFFAYLRVPFFLLKLFLESTLRLQAHLKDQNIYSTISNNSNRDSYHFEEFVFMKNSQSFKEGF